MSPSTFLFLLLFLFLFSFSTSVPGAPPQQAPTLSAPRHK
jgi:hypothetical protein